MGTGGTLMQRELSKKAAMFSIAVAAWVFVIGMFVDLYSKTDTYRRGETTVAQVQRLDHRSWDKTLGQVNHYQILVLGRTTIFSSTTLLKDGAFISGMAIRADQKVKFVAAEKPDSFSGFLWQSGGIYEIFLVLVVFAAAIYCSIRAAKLSMQP